MTGSCTHHGFGRSTALTILLVLPASLRAFQPLPFPQEIKSSSSNNNKGGGGGGGGNFDANDALDILSIASNNPSSASAVRDDNDDNTIGDIVDLDKARDLASHYGKYSYGEVETMRDDLHADRVKNDSPNDVLFLERYLEDELTSQLQALKDVTPKPYLFEHPRETTSRGMFASTTATTTTTIADTPQQAASETKLSGFDFSGLFLELVETLAIGITASILVVIT